jgi:hypothetical protein
VSIYVLIAIVKKRLDLEVSLYTLLQILSVSLFEKISIQQAGEHASSNACCHCDGPVTGGEWSGGRFARTRRAKSRKFAFENGGIPHSSVSERPIVNATVAQEAK